MPYWCSNCLTRMADLARGRIGKRLCYVDLIADTGITRTGQVVMV